MADLLRPDLLGASPEVRAEQIAAAGRPPTGVDTTGSYELGNHELPIARHRAEIEEAIRENSVTILVAPTGSGKTTQVPQFACEMRRHGFPEFDEIIVTQPRIVAARSISERVTSEVAGADQDYSIGYYTSRLRTAAPQRDQDIAFLTDGKAAAQLLHRDKYDNPDSARLLIIDEVHEWNANIELLLAIMAEKTNPASERYDANLKAVIMSATMDGERLQDYFADHSGRRPPLVEVTVPPHDVRHSVVYESVAGVSFEIAKRTAGVVLAFVPGKREIRQVEDDIASRQTLAADPIPVVPLHAQQTREDQDRAFLSYPGGAVVATTNAAETSLTVPEAVAVVDSGEVRIDRVRYDLVPGGSDGLYLEDAPQANLKQRAGRVGRTGPGEYVLCSPDGETPPVPPGARLQYGTPSIQRGRLDSLVLRLKATGHEVGDFKFYHQPKPEAVKAAQRRLVVLGALDEEGRVTDRGKRMEALPLDPEYACMLVVAEEQGYSEAVKENLLDIVAIMQLGGILKRGAQEQRWRELLKKDLSGEVVAEADSDFLAQLEAYVALTYDVDKEHWGDYDIIEYNAEQVEQSRASLARALGRHAHAPTAVTPENRQAVLRCINAGQLNQLWRRDGEKWRLALGQSEAYDLAPSSLVHGLGKLVTGTLFSLGTRRKTVHSIQNVNRVFDVEALARLAPHLVEETIIEKSLKYDNERRGLVVSVSRSLGELILQPEARVVEPAPDSPEMDLLKESLRQQVWQDWPERKKRRPPPGRAEVEAALENPEVVRYGTDSITGEPLLAYRGGKGQWCQSREVAIRSLEARKRQLEKSARGGRRRRGKNQK